MQGTCSFSPAGPCVQKITAEVRTGLHAGGHQVGLCVWRVMQNCWPPPSPQFEGLAVLSVIHARAAAACACSPTPEVTTVAIHPGLHGCPQSVGLAVTTVRQSGGS